MNESFLAAGLSFRRGDSQPAVRWARCKVVWATFVPVVLKYTELLPFFSVSVPAEYVCMQPPVIWHKRNG